MTGIAHPARLTVGVVGTGRVGSVLGAALARAGHTVVAAYGVSAESKARAARLLPGVPLKPADQVVREAGLEVLGISLVTNLAAGISGEPLNHQEVLEAGKAAASRMGYLLGQIVPRI